MSSITTRALNEIAEVLCGIKDVALMRRFMESILTQGEREEIAGRWELVKLLDRGISQRQVAKRLGMNLCKITRGSRELKKRDSALRRSLTSTREDTGFRKEDMRESEGSAIGRGNSPQMVQPRRRSSVAHESAPGLAGNW